MKTSGGKTDTTDPRKLSVRKSVDADIRYKALFEQSPYGVLIIDTEGNMVDFNDAAHHQLGYSREEFAQLRLSDIDPVQSPEEIRENIGNVLKNGGADFEVKHRTKNGEKRDVHVITQVLVLSGQTVFHTIWRDITEQKRLEESLKQTNAQFHALINAIPDMIFFKDISGRYLMVNTAFEMGMGASKEMFIGKSDDDFMPPDLAERCRMSDEQLMKSGRTLHNIEDTIIGKDGEKIYLESIKGPIHETNGRLLGVVGMCRDVTERKRSEAKLRENEDKFRSIFEQATDGIMIADAETKRHIEANRAMCIMLGYTHDEIVGLTVDDIHPKEDLPAIRNLFDKQLHGEIALAPEVPLLRKDGSVFYADINSTNVVLGGKQCLAGIFRDITQHKLAAEKVRQSEAKYRNLFESSTDGIFIIDLDGNFIDVNTTAYMRLGYTKEEMLALHIGKLDHPEFAPQAPERMKQIREHGFTVFETAHLRKDGTAMPVEVNSRLIEYEGRTVFFSVIRDITERKKADDLILRSLKEKEVLLKEIHHRVKNNMQVICSLLNLQAKGTADTTIRAMFEEARNRVLSMALIHEKLYGSADLAHVEFKEYLTNLVSRIADTYKRQDVVFSVDMEPLVLDVNVGIPCGLIVNELISNSLKHAFPEGRKGAIRIGINKNGSRNNVLTVADNGVSFPETVDFRNTSSLGMQLVNVLTGQIHGTIELSKEDGTRFDITFPGNSNEQENKNG